MHKTYPYIPLFKEESLLFPLLRPQRCRVYIYRPKYRETKEEFDRGCRGRRLKKIQNGKRERRGEGKEREGKLWKSKSSRASIVGWLVPWPLILWIVRVKRPFRNLHGNCQPALGFHKRFENVGT